MPENVAQNYAAVQGNTAGAGASSPYICYYCNQQGHIKRVCPKLAEDMKSQQNYSYPNQQVTGYQQASGNYESPNQQGNLGGSDPTGQQMH
jgi:hypothetical protein